MNYEGPNTLAWQSNLKRKFEEIWASNRSTYWSRFLKHINVVRPIWPVFFGVLFILLATLGNTQGREALKFSTSLQTTDGVYRTLWTIASCFLFSIGMFEISIRTTNNYYPYSPNSKGKLWVRYLYAWLISIAVPVFFTLHFANKFALDHIELLLSSAFSISLKFFIILLVISAVYDFLRPAWTINFLTRVVWLERISTVVIKTTGICVLLLLIARWTLPGLIGIFYERQYANAPASAYPAFLSMVSVFIASTISIYITSNYYFHRRHYLRSSQFITFSWRANAIAMFLAILVTSIAIAIVLAPVFVPTKIGPVSTILTSTGALVLTLTFFSTFATKKRGMPAILAVVALLVLGPAVSRVGHHDVQLVPTTSGETRTTLEKAIAKWHLSRSPEQPAIIVLAEGGGIRAAIHTANLLACLDTTVKEFRTSVLVYSGVSGGAVGISAFIAASYDANPPNVLKTQCDFEEQLNGPQSTPPVVTKFLQSDFFSPLVGSYLLRDLPLNLTVCAILDCASFPVNDRAAIFEIALENAYQKALSKAENPARERAFELPFGSVVENSLNDQPAPIVIFNTFDAGKGRPSIVSNVRMSQLAGRFSNVIPEGCNFDVTLATAAHLSARFPLVSPPGTVNFAQSDKCPNEVLGPYVDGGYFDNSGAAAVIPIIQSLKSQGIDRKIVVLHIMYRGQEHGLDSQGLGPLFNLTTPLDAAIRARQVHSSTPLEQLCEAILGGDLESNSCAKLDGWLASRTPNFAFVSKNFDDRLTNQWIRAPLQIPSENEPGGVELPLGWLLGEAGPLIEKRVVEQQLVISPLLNRFTQ